MTAAKRRRAVIAARSASADRAAMARRAPPLLVSPVSEANQDAFVRGISKRQARIDQQNRLRATLLIRQLRRFNS